MQNNIDFYNNNADQYSASITTADISEQLNTFLRKIPHGGKILDGGCGTGRDSLAMIKQGYQVSAFDASYQMAKIASKNIGIDVEVATFEDIELEDNLFDGVWCMSSLLHVARENMPIVISKLFKALKPGGYLYCTYKFRDSDFCDGKRSFTCYNEESFLDLVGKTDFIVERVSIFADSRVGREDEQWICALLKKPI